MNATKVRHTPGKWRVETGIGWSNVFDERGVNIAHCQGSSGVLRTTHGDFANTDEQAAANAYLIASAPELLEALQLDLLFHSRHFSADSLADFQAAGYRGSDNVNEMRDWLVARKQNAITKAQAGGE